MKDVDKNGDIQKEHYCVYLYKLDIDEYGEPIKLGSVIEQYLLYHILLFDEVILQTSAILKRNDLYRFFLCNMDLFKTTYDGHHLISPYLGNKDTLSAQFFGEYLNKRIETVKKKSSFNSELDAYKRNRADLVAQKLDNNLIITEMPVANKDTDSIFRQTVIDTGEERLWKIDSSNKTFHLLSDYAQGADIFQTFFLLHRVERTHRINEKGSRELGNWLRKNYYIANTLATLCIPIDDFHVDFSYIMKYIKVIGLNRLMDNDNSINPEAIIQIKSWDCYKYLQSIFFNSPKVVIDYLYRLYCESRFARIHKPFYKKKEFYWFCKLYSINSDLFAYALNSLHKNMDELLKRRRVISI